MSTFLHRHSLTMSLIPQDFNSVWLRALCFLACIPSIGALLAKVYGIASMRMVTLDVFLPCAVGLAGAVGG